MTEERQVRLDLEDRLGDPYKVQADDEVDREWLEFLVRLYIEEARNAHHADKQAKAVRLAQKALGLATYQLRLGPYVSEWARTRRNMQSFQQSLARANDIACGGLRQGTT